MSLKVWLPLLGSLENKGVSNVTATNVGATVNTAGKIGSCYLFDGTDDYIQLTDFTPNGWAEFSLSAWVYPTTSFDAFFLIRGSGAHRVNVNANGFTFRDTNNSTLRATQFASTIAVNTWTHITCVYKHGEVWLYQNGILSTHNTTYYNASSTLLNDMSEIRIARSQSSSGNFYYTGKINDFRIYDHALSSAEVHELSQGLVCHYKLDTLACPNLLTGDVNNAANWTADGATKSQDGDAVKVVDGGTSYRRIYYTTSNVWLTVGTVYTVSFDAKAIADGQIIRASRSVADYAPNFKLSTEWKHYSGQITLTAENTGGTISIQSATTNGTFWIKNCKVERSPIETRYSLNPDTIVVDSSGYEHHGTTTGTFTISNNTPRNLACLNFTAGASMVNCGRGGMVTDSITVNMWVNYSSWANPISCTESGGWNFENNPVRFPVYISGVGYKTAIASAQPSSGAWHMLTGTYDRIGQTVNIYIDGVLSKTTATGSSNVIGYHTSNNIWIGGEATGSGASNGMVGLISDVRIYATALSAADIKKLYETSQEVDSKNNIHSFNFDESSTAISLSRNKSTVSSLSEFNILSTLKYDTNTYIEPDGSVWVRVFHHNNPGAGSFASSDTFASSVYKDENRWFNVEVANYLDKWELMVKGRFTSTSDEWKLRWIQQYNPMTATFANVAVANVTKITTAGYSSSPSAWGGLYCKNGSTYLSANNGTSGNWWGAVGSFSVYQSGIPGWGPTGTVTTTGYNDLYLRIDNVTITVPPNAQFKKSGIMTAANFIET